MRLSGSRRRRPSIPKTWLMRYAPPLNQMYGFVQLLADESMPLDDEQRREVIQGIHEGCEQLTRVVLEIDTVAAKLDEMDSLMKVESVLK